MDPITAAILAAIAAGAIGGLTEVSKTALTDAYTRLKATLIKKFGHKSEVVQVEAKPTSDAITPPSIGGFKPMPQNWRSDADHI